MRFIAPPRAEVQAAVFDHPVFAEYQAWRALLVGEHWPDLAVLSAEVEAATCAAGIAPHRLIAQDPALLADGLHYEQRIAASGGIATRRDNWHDLLNALVWARHPRLKRAMNLRQAADVQRVGPRERSRGQCALTHFDEAGVVLVLADPARVAAWDEHDWPRLFIGLPPEEAAVAVIGHALLEHALDPQRLLVGKALLACSAQPARDLPGILAALAERIAAGGLLSDPQELRPLPLMGLPGWHAHRAEPGFFSLPCFQPRRADRRYPPALVPGDALALAGESA